MRFQAQPASVSAVPAPGAVVPSVRIAQLQIEGCGPISSAGVREGFREAWLRGDHSASAWNVASGEQFQTQLALNVRAGITGRELGRRLAEAILSRARGSGRGD